MSVYESWNYDRLTDEQAEKYSIHLSGELGMHSFRDKFSIKCKVCDELLHESTTNPSAYINIHEKTCNIGDGPVTN